MILRNRKKALLAALTLALLGLTAATAAGEEWTVDYRLKVWNSMHFQDAKTAKVYLDTLKKLGCEVRQEQHADHINVLYRCPAWRTILLGNHGLAHRWEEWLQNSGFETRHEH